MKFSLEFVGKYSVPHSLLDDCFVWIFSSHFGNQTIFPHDSLHFLVIHGRKPHFDASPAIGALALVEDLSNFPVVFVILVWLISAP